MQSRDFAYWLQGFFEIVDPKNVNKPALSSEQVDIIRRHLALVFKHEIDPSFGSDQDELNKIHFPFDPIGYPVQTPVGFPGTSTGTVDVILPYSPSTTLIRC
jgi:hypothetical protein